MVAAGWDATSLFGLSEQPEIPGGRQQGISCIIIRRVCVGKL